MAKSIGMSHGFWHGSWYRKKRKKAGRFRRIRSRIFPFLSIVSQLLGIVILLQIALSIISIVMNIAEGEILSAVATLISSVVSIVVVMAIAEGIDLMFRVAEQQQRIAEVLHRIEDKLQWRVLPKVKGFWHFQHWRYTILVSLEVNIHGLQHNFRTLK